MAFYFLFFFLSFNRKNRVNRKRKQVGKFPIRKRVVVDWRELRGEKDCKAALRKK